jgi:hypothetical protein
MPRTIANILADQNERRQIPRFGQVQSGEYIPPSEIERLACAGFPLRWRHERRRCLDALVKHQVTVARLTGGHAFRIGCHGEHLVWVLKIAERRVGQLDRFDGERIGVRRRGIERADDAGIMTGRRVVEQNRKQVGIRNRLRRNDD